ncbi:alpha/beta fold hydrolase [Anianabacter salinae]|uniref:alpha/beta fold hydrolase n=1 Tax=Anianabacter salinae TaxID=2851023 RepID=UPI00225E52CA|nr:alpha/beta fold hydrolase [Anianabacter salinae]MBV0912703.1 alpha/beta fold hydrolase [Anianabacter salinae]
MARLVLIHGACHGAFCWRDVIGPLRAAGHDVVAIDLPGMGDDLTPTDGIDLDSYAQAALAACATPSILVGHSLGGLTITEAAATDAAHIRGIVYLAAWAPKPGESGASLRKTHGCEALQAATVMSEDRQTFTFAEDAHVPVFYADCPPETVAFARKHIRPQPVKPSQAPAKPLPADLPRHYIRCTEDRAIPYAAQVAMTDGWPPGTVHDLPTSHSPFFAAPDRLAALLDRIAKDIP